MSYDIDYDAILEGRIDYAVIEEERKRQTAMMIIEALDEHIEELDKGKRALEGAIILVDMAYEIAAKYGPEDPGWQDHLTTVSRRHAIVGIGQIRRELTRLLKDKEARREDPLNEKRVSE